MAFSLLLKLLCIITLVCQSLSVTPEQHRDADRNENTRPNVLLFLADDLGRGDVSSYGESKVVTPNIDRLAKEGILFDRMYSQPMCTPSRSALMTGRLPSRNGMIQGMLDISVLISAAQPSGIADPIQEPNLASILQSLNYKTSLVGKWHLGFAHKGSQGPVAKGFDEFYGIPMTHMATCSSQIDWKNWTFVSLCWNMWRFKLLVVGLMIAGLRMTVCGNRGMLLMLSVVAISMLLMRLYIFMTLANKSSCVWINGTQVVEQPYKDSDATIRITDESIKFLKRVRADNERNQQPFFLSVNFMTPHQLPIVSKYHSGKSGKGLYSDCVMETDWSVGKIMATLKESGFDRNTIVYFTSDNGATRHNMMIDETLTDEKGGSAGTAKNGNGLDVPLRGWKGTNFEGGIRVPSMIRWLDVIEKGQVSEAVTSQMDFFPTILDIVGLGDRVVKQRLDGKSLLRHIKNPKRFPLHHDVLFHYCDTTHIGAVTYHNYKLHFFEGTKNYTCRGVTYDKPKLYDLDSDPGEERPLSLADYNGVVGAVNAALEEHKKSMASDSVYLSQMNFLPRPWDYPCENFPTCAMESKITDDFTGLVDDLL